MDDVTLARAIHVLAVVLWIGGVALVTTVLLPAVRRFKSPEERIFFFESVEQSFAFQSWVTTVVAGLSGLYIIYRLDLWSRFASIEFWWMHAMVGVWLLFSLILFIAEPVFLRRWFLAHMALWRDVKNLGHIVDRAALVGRFHFARAFGVDCGSRLRTSGASAWV